MNKKIPIVIAIIALFAVSSISLAGAQTTMAPQSSPNGIVSRNYIRINGIITEWETTPTVTPVKGMLQTQARIGTFENGNINQLAMATAIWTNSTSRPLNTVALKQNFTYTFYEARLANGSVSSLITPTSTTDYVLSGKWNFFTVVNNVTVYTDDATGQITGVHRTMDKSVQRLDGTLTVTGSLSKFTLSITSIPSVTGTVLRSVQRQVAFNPFKVTDDITTNAITRADAAQIIRAYGAMPGWGNYDARMDFCGHFKIDIANLSTLASNM